MDFNSLIQLLSMFGGAQQQRGGLSGGFGQQGGFNPYGGGGNQNPLLSLFMGLMGQRGQSPYGNSLMPWQQGQGQQMGQQRNAWNQPQPQANVPAVPSAAQGSSNVNDYLNNLGKTGMVGFPGGAGGVLGTTGSRNIASSYVPVTGDTGQKQTGQWSQ